MIPDRYGNFGSFRARECGHAVIIPSLSGSRCMSPSFHHLPVGEWDCEVFVLHCPTTFIHHNNEDFKYNIVLFIQYKSLLEKNGISVTKFGGKPENHSSGRPQTGMHHTVCDTS